MKTAKRNYSIIHLHTIPREDYQSIHEESMRGGLSCPVCGKEVRLHLGITREPHFYHPGNVEQNHLCTAEIDDSEPFENRKEPEAAETKTPSSGGFSLPKSRAIGQTASDSAKTVWKPSKPLTGLPPYRKPDVSPAVVADHYFQLLTEHGVFLDEEQWEAVSHTEGPLLVFAGAGSGKTRVLTARTAYMICEKAINPASIMLVTFTAKASKEMKKRIAGYPGLSQSSLRSLVAGTFHSIFYKILAHHESEKWQSCNLLKWEWQREKIIKEAGRELDLDEKEFAFDAALQQIGYWKNSRMLPADIKPDDQWEERAAFLYKRYEEAKKQKGWFDFDDMLSGCYELLSENKELLEKYQQRFQYFLIDEFQDINRIQYDIIKLLSSHTGNVCAVGDDDQSIYGFRGSEPAYILNFPRDFANTRTVTLDQNYRSAHPVVSAANEVICLNKNRKDKRMQARYDNQMPPVAFYPHDEEEEATMIVTDMKEKIQNGVRPSEFAILYRTHSASRAMFERLAQSNLPFVVDRDAESFYERRMVRTMLAYMRLSLNPDDSKAMSDLLMALFIKRSALRDLKASSILEDCSMLDALQELDSIHPFQKKKLKKIIPLFSKLKTLAPVAAISMIEQEMGFQDFIKKSGNEGNTIEKGSDDIRDLKVVAKKFPAIADLLAHADHMTAMNDEMKKLSKQFEDAIQLSTIHRSKGLEYEHVYILGAAEGGLPHDHALESWRNGDDIALEEERRLLYVAMTRAKESLTLSIPERRRGKAANPSRFLKHLLRGTVVKK
ncbi:UvrD-helicase domain-containing protein [Bacillus marinisedimentorum]|uniref:UvrD-helicase domain-containing protein n=1 Tax=Bacillus marinisedimentorum TaxID=1821260 RepID=UPI0008727481|nr:ATP-dependent helicase [Bacillus marinisedimentorum]